MHTSFVQTHIDFREFKVSLFDVQPNIGIGPIVDARELNTAQMIAGTAPYRNAMVRKFIKLPTPAHDATMEQA